MANAKSLLGIGLGIIEQEMTRLKGNAEKEGTREDPDNPESPIMGGLSGVQANKLSSYMTTLRQLVDKDIDGHNEEEMTQEQLIEELDKFNAERAGKDEKGSNGKRKTVTGRR